MSTIHDVLTSRFGVLSDALDADSTELSKNIRSSRREISDSEDALRVLDATIRNGLRPDGPEAREKHEAGSDTTACFFSPEFLIDRSLPDALARFHPGDAVRTVADMVSPHTQDDWHQAQRSATGNDGLIRLAALFLKSCAGLPWPVVGYGLRHDNSHGALISDSRLRDEVTWDRECHEDARRVHFYGHTEQGQCFFGHPRFRWRDSRDVLAVPCDVPIPGHQNGNVNTFRLWKPAATDHLDRSDFNTRKTPAAVASVDEFGRNSMLLLPHVPYESTRERALQQQYFFVSACLQDVLDLWARTHADDFSDFGASNRIHLSGLQQSLAVPELMRLLLDEYDFEWEPAWKITRQCIADSHQPGAYEVPDRPPVAMFESVLPRVLEIIHEINRRFLADAALVCPNATDLLAGLSLISEGESHHVRLAHVGILGSRSDN